MNAADVARADQVRAAIVHTLAFPCSCGDCLTDDQLVALLELDDPELLAIVDAASEVEP